MLGELRGQGQQVEDIFERFETSVKLWGKVLCYRGKLTGGTLPPKPNFLIRKVH